MNSQVRREILGVRVGVVVGALMLQPYREGGGACAELDELEREAALKMNKAAAKEATAIAYREAAKDLGGDPKFSGWRPWLQLDVKPIPGKGAALLKPTRYSAGPWTVAQFGRNTNVGFANVRRTRDGGVKVLKSGRVSVRRRRRWNGVTAGKGTADSAVKVMDDKIPPIIEKDFGKLLRKRFDVT